MERSTFDRQAAEASTDPVTRHIDLPVRCGAGEPSGAGGATNSYPTRRGEGGPRRRKTDALVASRGTNVDMFADAKRLEKAAKA